MIRSEKKQTPAASKLKAGDRVEICGNIASGKTTLCQRMPSKGLSPILEDFQRNPFLEEFYNDPQAFSFETEVSFLLQHYHLIKINKGKKPFACDFSVILDMAYADVNLAGDRRRIFEEIVAELLGEVHLPSLIVQLVCPEEILLRRIAERDRCAEATITAEYLRAIGRAIALRIKGLAFKVPVITIDSDATNFTGGIDEVRELQAISNLE